MWILCWFFHWKILLTLFLIVEETTIDRFLHELKRVNFSTFYGHFNALELNLISGCWSKDNRFYFQNKIWLEWMARCLRGGGYTTTNWSIIETKWKLSEEFSVYVIAVALVSLIFLSKSQKRFVANRKIEILGTW